MWDARNPVGRVGTEAKKRGIERAKRVRRKRGEDEPTSNPWFRAHRGSTRLDVVCGRIVDVSVTSADPFALPLSDKARPSSLFPFRPLCLSFKPFNFLFARGDHRLLSCGIVLRGVPFYVLHITCYTTWSLVGEQPYCSLLCAMDLDFRFHSDEEPTSRVTCFVFRLSLCLRSRIRCPLRFPSSSRERSSIMGSSIVDCQLIASCYRDTWREKYEY